MLVSFIIGKKDNKKNVRAESIEELRNILNELNQTSPVSNVKVNGEDVYNLNWITVSEFSKKIFNLLEKNRRYLVVTLHDNDFWSLLSILGEHLSSINHYYSNDYFKEYTLNEYPLEKIKEYSLKYLQNCYEFKNLLNEKEDVEHIKKYFEENLDVYFMEEVKALAIDGNHEYLLVPLFEDFYEKDGYQIV